IPNVTVEPEQDPENLTQSLIDQVTGRVRWRETILKMKDLGVTRVVEVGAGKVLTGLVKRIDPELKTFNIETPEDIDAFLSSL
ncbi:ACP S-malonyltransferase, partial [Staphylococcus haemolyticus]|uniref:ACP S-malonyltransferase n=1 Tax=Staphylococcus haemolyticus TaxID=1283 RepID=UPI003B80F1F2